MPSKRQTMLTLFSTLILTLSIIAPTYANPVETEIELFAESAVLLDSKSGQVLYSKNEHKKMYPASITKLLTALIAIETNKPDDIISLSKEAVFSIEPGSSHIGLDVGEEVNLDQGLHALLLASANEVANGIAELSGGSIEAFCQTMTFRAKELGANNSNFTNPHGLHDPNHYTTAYDMALITSEIIKSDYFQEIMADTTYEIPATNKTDEIRYLSQRHRLMNIKRDSRMYREEVIAGKTGYTSVAGNTLVSVARKDDMELISVVLKSDRAHLYEDTNALLDYGFDNYKYISLSDDDNVFSTLPMYNLQNGQLTHIANCDITAKNNTRIIGPSNLKNQDIDASFSLPDSLTSTLKTNQVIGSVIYSYKGEDLGENDLIIKNINHIPVDTVIISPDKASFLSLDNYKLILIIASIFLLVFILILFLIYRRRKRKSRRKIRYYKY